MKTFILCFDPIATPSIAKLHAFIANNKHISHWLTPFSGVYFIKTDETGRKMTDMFGSFFTPGEKYIVSEIHSTETTGGRLGRVVWDWFNSEAPNALTEQ